jgi:hypothetical protein
MSRVALGVFQFVAARGLITRLPNGHVHAQETSTRSTIVSVDASNPWKTKSRQAHEVCRVLGWVCFSVYYCMWFDHSAYTCPLPNGHVQAQETSTHSTIASVDESDPWKTKSRQAHEVCRGLGWVCFWRRHGTWFDHSAYTRPLPNGHVQAQETSMRSTIASVVESDPWKTKSRQAHEVCRVLGWVCLMARGWITRRTRARSKMDMCRLTRPQRV